MGGVKIDMCACDTFLCTYYLRKRPQGVNIDCGTVRDIKEWEGLIPSILKITAPDVPKIVFVNEWKCVSGQAGPGGLD